MTGRITNQANQYGKDVEAYQVVAYLIQCLGNMFFYRLFTDFHLGGYFFIPQVLFAAQLVDRPALGRKGVDKPVDLVGNLFQQERVMLVVAEDCPVDQFIDRICTFDALLCQG